MVSQEQVSRPGDTGGPGEQQEPTSSPVSEQLAQSSSPSQIHCLCSIADDVLAAEGQVSLVPGK